MARYIAIRVVSTIPVLLGVVTIVFLMLRLIPGNPVILSLGTSATPQAVAMLTQRLGLNLPLWVQYAHYLGQLLHGNLGLSMQSSLPVQSLLAQRLVATLELAAGGMLVAVVVGLAFGVLSATTPSPKVEKSIIAGSTLFLAVPNFWLGIIMVMLFALTLHWLPVFGFGGLYHLALPALSVGLVAGAVNVRVVRNTVGEVLSQQYIRTALAKGLTRRKVVWKHALRNALIPVVTIVGLQFGSLLGGVVVIEQLFGWPGVGSLLISAIEARDYTLVQGGVLYLALIFIVVNLLVDVAYTLIDPRIRYA